LLPAIVFYLMYKKEKLILVKNAIANVIRGGATALVAIALPPFLTRLMSPSAFGAWVLILQLSAFVGYLDFGIQTAVGRFVAHANERGDTEHRDRIVNTSLAVLSLTCLVCILATAIAAFLLPRFFSQLPSSLVADTRVAFVLVASSLAIGLPASVINGIFVGLQRNEIPAATIGGSRIFSAVLLILVIRQGGNLRQMAVAVALVNLATYLIQYIIFRRMAPRARLSPRLVSRKTSRELFDYCWSLTIWSFAMLLITGLDITLVGHFQFGAVAFYAVAASLVTFIAGLQNAVFNALIPATAVLHARGDPAELGRIMIVATRYGAFLLLLTGLPIIILARNVLTLWVGSAYAAHGVRLLQVLVAANIIRLSATPYVVTLIGAGQQKLLVVTPILEGFSNLLVSVAAGYFLGAMGVALGTLLGSFIGVGGNFFYNMRRTTSLKFRISDYLRDGLLRPSVCAIPVVALVLILHGFPHTSLLLLWISATLALLTTVACLWHWGLSDREREKLRPQQVLALAARGFDADR
jgi:O-antigen/teichoic acid export membrane protein